MKTPAGEQPALPSETTAENEKNVKSKAKPAKEKKPKGKAAKEEAVELPMLVEIGYTFSGILLVFVALAVAVVSLISGASLIEIFLRTLISVVVLGCVLWLFTWQFTTGVLQGAMLSLEEEEKQKAQKAIDHEAAAAAELAEAAQNGMDTDLVREI